VIGRLREASNLNQTSFKAWLLHLGLRPIRFPDLRHTCATLLLRRGFHPESFEELLGHCTISIALGTYSHVLLDVLEHVTRALKDTLSCRVAVQLQ